MLHSVLAPATALLLLCVARCPSEGVTAAGEAERTRSPGAAPSPQASCNNPAPLLGTKDPRAPGYIVVFQDGTDAGPTARALAAKYTFQTKFVYSSALLGFSADLPDAVVAALRCESAVKYIQHEGVVSTAG